MWNKFLSNVEKILFDMSLDGADIPFFRGHSNSEWPLLSSLYRLKYHKKRRNNLEKVLYYDFIAYSGAITPKGMTS